MATLRLGQLYRPREERVGLVGGSQAERRTFDFVVDGQSLNDLLNARHYDFVGLLSSPPAPGNIGSVAALLLDAQPTAPNGRYVLYVCPECGDISCGALTCEIVREDDRIVWRNLGYENDYDPEMSVFDVYADVGPFSFDWNDYLAVLRTALPSAAV